MDCDPETGSWVKARGSRSTQDWIAIRKLDLDQIRARPESAEVLKVRLRSEDLLLVGSDHKQSQLGHSEVDQEHFGVDWGGSGLDIISRYSKSTGYNNSSLNESANQIEPNHIQSTKKPTIFKIYPARQILY